MHLRFIKYFLFILVLTTSCALREESELVMPARPAKLFVEAYLSPGAPIKLSLIRGSNFQDDLSLQLVWNAKAELILADTTIELQNIFYKDKESGKLVNYANAYQLPATLSQDSVQLRIITEDKKDTLYAATTPVEPLKITDWSSEGKQILIKCANGVKAKNRYYGIYLEYELKDETIRTSEFYDYSPVQDKELTFRVEVPNGKRAYRVMLYRITQTNYEFQRGLQEAYRSNADPFQAPIILPTNIRGGTGIFTYSTVDTLLIE